MERTDNWYWQRQYEAEASYDSWLKSLTDEEYKAILDKYDYLDHDAAMSEAYDTAVNDE